MEGLREGCCFASEEQKVRLRLPLPAKRIYHVLSHRTYHVLPTRAGADVDWHP
jgi:hypothetical protein